MPQNKRRGAVRQRKDDDSESDNSGDDRSADAEEVSASPDVPSQPLSRRSSNVDKLGREGFGPLPQIAVTLDRRDEGPLPGPSSLRAAKPPHLNEGRSLFHDNELPAIATLSLPEPSPSTPAPMSAPTLLPLRPASEQQAASRKRAATIPGKIPRTAANSGPKVVASRKTKCDGAHPACASCARRSLPCNYIHDSGPAGQGQKKGRRSSSSKPPTDSPHSVSPPSSRMVPTPSTGNDAHEPREDILVKTDFDLKRPLDYPEAIRPLKKLRMENTATAAGIP
ncbi:hypothetical protein C0993_007069 [Termitomyces sp. T159_Od127]|nr:hypothetical protein C0993_007069 [Termitomyces sp. T159_Od127]